MRPRRHPPTAYAVHGYTEGTAPSVVTLYRDRAASDPLKAIPTSDPAAPKRTDTTVTIGGTTYRLVWID